MAPLYVAMTGLTESDLPVETCPTVIEVPGFCVGSATDITADYVVHYNLKWRKRN